MNISQKQTRWSNFYYLCSSWLIKLDYLLVLGSLHISKQIKGLPGHSFTPPALVNCCTDNRYTMWCTTRVFGGVTRSSSMSPAREALLNTIYCFVGDVITYPIQSWVLSTFIFPLSFINFGMWCYWLWHSGLVLKRRIFTFILMIYDISSVCSCIESCISILTRWHGFWVLMQQVQWSIR